MQQKAATVRRKRFSTDATGSRKAKTMLTCFHFSKHALVNEFERQSSGGLCCGLLSFAVISLKGLSCTRQMIGLLQQKKWQAQAAA